MMPVLACRIPSGRTEVSLPDVVRGIVWVVRYGGNRPWALLGDLSRVSGVSRLARPLSSSRPLLEVMSIVWLPLSGMRAHSSHAAMLVRCWQGGCGMAGGASDVEGSERALHGCSTA